MQRVLARVLDLKQISENSTEEGFTIVRVLLKVKVEDKGAKGFRLPPRTKGKRHWIVRDYLEPWRVEKGDLIVLDPQEVNSLLSPLRLNPRIVVPREGRIAISLSLHNPFNREGLEWVVNLGELGGERRGLLGRDGLSNLDFRIAQPREGVHPATAECGGFRTKAVVPWVKRDSTLSYRLDVNSDGFEEVVLENSWLRAVIIPHLGGRIGSLIYKATNRDKFSSPLEYGKEEYIEYGGSDDRLGTEPPGELWNAEFKTVELGRSWVLLTHRSKGLEVKKRVEILPNMPALYQRVSFSLRRRGEKEIVYWHRIPFAVGEQPHRNVVLVPTQEKLESMRYHAPLGWPRPHSYFGLKFGGLLFHNEEESLLCLTDPESIDFAVVRVTRSFLVSFIRRKPTKLKRGESVSYSSLYLLGEGFSISEGSLAIISRGEERRGRVPVSISLREVERPGKISASICADQEERKLPLTGKDFEGVGRVWTGRVSSRAPEHISGEVITASTRHSVNTPRRTDV